MSDFIRTTTLDDGTPWLNCARLQDGYLLRFVDYADYFVDGAGSRIVCRSTEQGVTLNTIRHLVLDQVFPMVLNLRGREALHATGIVTPRGAVAFTGPTGSGKSTLAASFFMVGSVAMCDDCLALIDDGNVIRAIPAYPGLRLWTDAARALNTDASSLREVANYSSKRRMLSAAHLTRFPREPQPLVRIYRIMRPSDDEGPLDAPTIEELAPPEAFIEMVSSTFPLDVTDRDMLARHFRFIQRLAERVPIKRLRIPTNYAALPAVRAAILADLESV